MTTIVELLYGAFIGGVIACCIYLQWVGFGLEWKKKSKKIMKEYEDSMKRMNCAKFDLIMKLFDFDKEVKKDKEYFEENEYAKRCMFKAWEAWEKLNFESANRAFDKLEKEMYTKHIVCLIIGIAVPLIGVWLICK